MKVCDFLPEIDDTLPEGEFPFVHSTFYRKWDENNKRYINPATCKLKRKILEKSKCDKFGENLLYFYYGRPAYRLKDKDDKKDIKDQVILPVVFIFKPIPDGNFKRVYPFDSGAYNMYVNNYGLDNNPLNPKIPKPGYKIDNSLLAIRHYVKAIFGSNKNYYYGKYEDGNNLHPSVKQHSKKNTDLQSLLNLIAEKKNYVDDRRKTVEIQSANDYYFNGKLLAVAAPDFLMDKPEFYEAIVDNGAQPLRYYVDMKDFNGYLQEVYMCIEEFYKDKYIQPGDHKYED